MVDFYEMDFVKGIATLIKVYGMYNVLKILLATGY